MNVDVYPVGWLAAIRSAWRYLTVPAHGEFPRRFWWQILRQEWRYDVMHARAKNWRAVRNAFNGYLAEPDEFPDGDYRRRCGTGWTKRRALRSLHRRLPAATGTGGGER